MMRDFIRDERGTAPLILLMIAMLCVLGVLGYDFSRAHAVRARLQTAADAASLAACMKAKTVVEHEYTFIDAGGNETGDQDQAVEVRSAATGRHYDLQDPSTQEEARGAADAAFVKNLVGQKMPARDTVGPGSLAALPDRLSGYDFQANVDWNSPSHAADGSVYYDRYVIPRAQAGVRSFLLVKLFRAWQGQDVFGALSEAPKPDAWSGAIRLEVDSKAQAIPGQS
jgi:hypothetical protein